MEILFLGTGTSYGIPMIGCECGVCLSSSPKNKRLRSSILVSYNNKNILIDTTPDLRTQMLAHAVKHIDAVLITHHHADHLFGLDDIRIYNQIQKQPICCYSSADTIEIIKKCFYYIFSPSTPKGGGLPKIELAVMDNTLDLFGEKLTPIPIFHGDVPILGFRWRDFAYITDCSYMPDQSIELLSGIDTLVLNGLRYRPHITHYSIEQALEVIEKIKPTRAYLTHISHDVDHENLIIPLPDNVALAYDGLKLDV